MPSQIERLAIVETQLANVLSVVDKNTGKLDRVLAIVEQAHGAARAGRWIGHGLTAVIAFAVSQFGGHLPSFH